MAGVHVRQVAKARQEKSITSDMDFLIELDDPSATEILTSFDKIKGQVHLVNKSRRHRVIEVQDVKVWLEGTATTRFKTKVEGKTLIQFQHTRFIPDETTNLDHVSCTLIRRDDDKETKTFRVGTRSFPFEIQLNGEILPSTFQSSFCRIQYRIVLHVQILWDINTILKFSKSIVMTTKGCLNLFLNEALNSPFVVSKTKEKFFSSRPILKAQLELNRRGFIPGEYLTFQFQVENFNGAHVSLLCVRLVQKIIYSAHRLNKTTSGVLDKKEFYCETKETEIHWEEGLFIPRELMPSFSKHKKSVQVLYYIQFTVDFGGKSQVKGETMLVIGSVRPEFTNTETESPKNKKFDKASSQLTRDHFSLENFCALEPLGYSALSTRQSSLDTLPPPYDEAFADDWEHP